jgi:hypothetical protein
MDITYPNYRSDCVGETFLENLDQGGLREHMFACPRIARILRELAKVSESTPHPLIVREQVLDPAFVEQIPDAPRNEGRDGCPRFLVVDLDSFRSFAVD